MPITFLTWLVFYLDRANLALARINGLETDLRLQGAQFNIALMLFSILYILLNIPGNLVLRRVGARLWLPGIIIAWGIVTVASGFITNFAGLCVTRVFLGAAESSFLGGVLLYLGFFYTRDEIVTRIGIFYSSTPLANSIGGLLAGGLVQINYNGYNGWPWIFFIEGALTVVFGIASFILMPNTPAEANFLTPDEKIVAVHRMEAENTWIGVSGVAVIELEPNSSQPRTLEDKLDWATAKRAILSPLTLMMAVGCFLSIETVTGYSFFLPTLIDAMGYKQLQATLMTVPPNFIAFVFVIAMARWSQRRGTTGTSLNLCAALGAVGFLLLLVGAYTGPGGLPLASLQYVGTFLVAMGVNAIPPLALAWLSINASPYYARAITLGFVIGFGSLAAFISAFTYIKTAGPW
jgi:MFS family permease